MKDQLFGNLMDWGGVLEKLDHLKHTEELDNHQDELIRLLRFDGNWRLREAAVEAVSSLAIPRIDTARQVVRLIKRDDLYYNIRVMAAETLSKIIPVIMENNGAHNEVFRFFLNEANHEVTALLSQPAPPIFHDALEITFEQIQRAVAEACTEPQPG